MVYTSAYYPLSEVTVVARSVKSPYNTETESCTSEIKLS